MKLDTIWYRLPVKHLVESSVAVTELGSGRVFERGVDYQVDFQRGVIRALKGGQISPDQKCLVSYQYYPVYRSPYLGGEDYNDYFDGLRVRVWDDPLVPDSVGSRWLSGSELRDALERYGFIGGGDPLPAEHEEVSNYRGVAQLYPNQGVAVPYDYEIVLYDRVMWRSVNGRKPAKFLVFNVTLGDTSEFVFLDVNRDSTIGDQDVVIPVVRVGSRYRGTWQVKFWAPEDSVVWEDSVAVDTIRVAVAPKVGDVYRLRVRKPFTSGDVFRVEVEGARLEIPGSESGRDSLLSRIAVVPNPYVVTASWEPQHFYKFGRGRRKLDFIHLPSRCTIRIYTVRGYLVDVLEHDAPIDDGSESWDMLTKDGLEIAYGVYLYHVEAPGIGEKVGKFAVIK